MLTLNCLDIYFRFLFLQSFCAFSVVTVQADPVITADKRGYYACHILVSEFINNNAYSKVAFTQAG
jgi:hypothetical protein